MEGFTKRQLNILAKRNIYTPEDLVQFVPKRYHDYRTLQLVKNADQSKFGAFAGRLVYCDKRCGQKWYIVMRIVQDDGTNVVVLLFSDVFRYSYYSGMMNERIVVCGKPNCDDYGWSIKYAEEIVKEENFVPHISPVYTKIDGIADLTLQKGIDLALSCVSEPLDVRLVNQLRMMSYPQAIREIHHPSDERMLKIARQRFLLNDMIYFAEGLCKMEAQAEESSIVFDNPSLMNRFIELLPYELTEDQKRVIDVFCDTVKTKRFNALIQGDVGCGKTVVAISMIMMAVGSGYQAVIMAPREVLAKQHFDEVSGYAEKLGLSCTFLSSGLSGKKKDDVLNRIRTGEIQIIVGTHSCISAAVEYSRLGLTVIDEEHLFGVKQKEQLEEKAEEGIHSVSMSATPIPRSLATILYGHNKQIMTIKTMPKGRLPVITSIHHSHEDVFSFMEKEIRNGSQCYVVCPAIEQNDEYDIVSVEAMEREYRSYFEPKFRIGVVHGHKDSEEIAATIRLFSEGELDILMSTTVIEVGVNVPNTTVMVIEQAERFGLASLHQLRGRVGRSNKQSYCMLVSSQTSPRLQTMVRTTDGFEIAEADLQQRGSGDLLGLRQAGNNRFVNEMIKYSGLFQKAVEIVNLSKENGYGNHLESIYHENAESIGEEQ